MDAKFKAKIDSLILQAGVEAPPVDIEKVALLAGASAIKRTPLNVDGMSIPSNKGCTIVLNSAQSELRQRFTCAHEVGHLLLSEHEQKGIQHRQSVPTPRASNLKEERLCEEIAATILMPKGMFTNFAQKHNWETRSIPILARTFKTSLTSTAIRFVDLIEEGVLLALWQPSNNTAKAWSLKWSKYNRFGDSSKSGLSINNSVYNDALIQASFNTNQVCKAPFLLVKSRGAHSKFLRVHTEAFGFGVKDNRRVFTLSFPARQLT